MSPTEQAAIPLLFSHTIIFIQINTIFSTQMPTTVIHLTLFWCHIFISFAHTPSITDILDKTMLDTVLFLTFLTVALVVGHVISSHLD